jgi:outer membrane immunogenic protein
MGKSLFTTAAILVIASAGSVRAADLGVERQDTYQPAVVSAPFAVWTGCFAGGNIGYVSAHWNANEISPVPFSPGTTTADNIALGGQIGCDYQMGPWVVGIQGMGDGTGLKATASQFSGVTGTPQFRESWIATGTGRIGYTVAPSILLYARGGVGWAQQEGVGWTAGGGLEWKCLPDLSLFAEYNYLGLGTKNITLSAFPPLVLSSNVNIQTVLVGFNYRFNFGAPVTTRY